MPIAAAAAVSNASPATPAIVSPAESVRDVAIVDETAETIPDYVATVSQQLARQAQLVLMRQQSLQTDLQLRLDRLRADFNSAQETRSEQLREMNALRDMAVEQGKKDDEILKKYISMI